MYMNSHHNLAHLKALRNPPKGSHITFQFSPPRNVDYSHQVRLFEANMQNLRVSREEGSKYSDANIV